MRKESVTPTLMLLNAGIARHNMDWNWKKVNSPFARFYFPFEGTAKVHFNKKSHDLSPGHIYMIPPFVLHGYECLGYYSHYYFHVYEKPSAKVRVLEEYNYPFELEADETDIILSRRLLKINPGRELPEYDPKLYDNPDTLTQTISVDIKSPYHTQVESHGLLCQILSRFLKYAVNKIDISDDRIYKALSYIRKNMDKKITIDELAELCYLSNDHFIRLFKKELNDTPLDYINKRKIEKAQLLLKTTDLLIKDIACGLSFSNTTYFNRLFKNVVGVNPQKYRSSS